MKKILMQLTLNKENRTLEIGLADEIQGEDRESIIALSEILSNKILMGIGKELMGVENE